MITNEELKAMSIEELKNEQKEIFIHNNFRRRDIRRIEEAIEQDNKDLRKISDEIERRQRVEDFWKD